MAKCLRENKISLSILLGLSMFHYALLAFVPIFVGYVIDTAIVTPGSESALIRYAFYGSAVVLILITMTIVTARQQAKYIHSVRVSLEKNISNAVLDNDMESSKVINLYNNEIDLIIEKYFLNIPNVLAVFIPFIIGLIYFISTSLMALGIMVGCLIIAMFVNQLILSPFAKYSKTLQEKNTDMNRIVTGYLKAIRSINIFSGKELAVSRLIKTISSKMRSEEKVNSFGLFIESINTFFSIIMQVIPLAVLCVMIFAGRITVGQALAIILLFEKIVAPIERIGAIRSDFSESKLIRLEMEQIVKKTGHVAEKTINLKNHNIVFYNVSVKFDRQYILRNVNFVFEENKKYLLMGSNGSGKSTIFKLLTKQITNYEGEIFIGNTNIKKIPEEQLFEILGIVTQSTEVIYDSVFNNIAFDNTTPSSVKKALSIVGFDRKVRLDDIIENDNFSGGEMQKIAIARAFCSSTSILLLDEITSSLHNEHAEHIENQIAALTDRLIIYISHRTSLNMQKKFDTTLTIENNTLAEIVDINESE